MNGKQRTESHLKRWAQLGALLAATLLPSIVVAHADARVTAQAGPDVLDGDSPQLLVTGLRPGEVAAIHVFRKAIANQPGSYTGTPVLAHAEAMFVADSAGTISVDRDTPKSGTYNGVDPLGLLWSGTRTDLAGDPAHPVTRDLHLASERDVVVRVEAPSLGENHWIETRIHLTDGAGRTEVQEVSLPGLNGAYARPRGPASEPLPAILLLTGVRVATLPPHELPRFVSQTLVTRRLRSITLPGRTPIFPYRRPWWISRSKNSRRPTPGLCGSRASLPGR